MQDIVQEEHDEVCIGVVVNEVSQVVIVYPYVQQFQNMGSFHGWALFNLGQCGLDTFGGV